MVEQGNGTGGLLKVGELAKAAGVSVSTAKFYVKEGLLRPACKTGRNMAYYSPDCVARIALIRRLQRERYYPLSVIKRLLDTPGVAGEQLELLDAIHKAGPEGAGRFSAAEAQRASGLAPKQAAELAAAGLISAGRTGRARQYTGADVEVMRLAKQRLDAGIPLGQTVRAFKIYQQALERAARQDVECFISGALMPRDFTAETGARMIRVSDSTLDAFIAIKRNELNRWFGSRQVEELEGFERALKSCLGRACRELEALGMGQAAAGCRAVLEGADPGFFAFAGSIPGDIARAIAECVKARERLLATLQAGPAAGLGGWVAALCWLRLAPRVLNCRKAAQHALSGLAAGGAELAGRLEAIFKDSGGET